METGFSQEKYDEMIGKLFMRFPSFQKAGASAYKPGIANMEFIDQLMGHPHRNYNIIHVAGTNGKGSVSNMLASALSACGLKVGLYTSPHILDFRERMRVVESVSRCVSKEYVYDFISAWQETFDHLDLSFFEITTIMALQWFAGEKVDYVVLETGLGGRLDSTNIVTPVLSIITNIGLDPKGRLVGWGRRVITFILVCFSWLFFRANTTDDAWVLLGKLFTAGGSLTDTLTHMSLDITNILMCILSVATLVIIDRLLKYEDADDGSFILVRNSSFIYYVWIIIFSWAILLSKDMASTFIYFQF